MSKQYDKTLTAREAMIECIKGSLVLAKHKNIKEKFVIKYDKGNFPFDELYRHDQVLSYDNNFFEIGKEEEFTYTFYEEPKQEEKKYRWLVKDDTYSMPYKHPNYITFDQVRGLESIPLARLDCLDDLKDESYYTEEF